MKCHMALPVALPLPLPQRRLRGKTPPAWVARGQISLPEPLELPDEARPDARRQVYLVTFPFPKQQRSTTGEVLVPSSSMSKEDLVQRMLEALARPEVIHYLQSHGPIPVKRVGCWREFHKAGAAGAAEAHDHLAVLAAEHFRFKGVKLALLRRSGLASHWSCSHDGYWSCVRYCSQPSPKKPAASLDLQPFLWDESGVHPPLEDCREEPVTAKALHAKRQKLMMQAREAGQSDPKVTDLDVWALVVRLGLRNTADNRQVHFQLVAHAKKHCGDAMVQYLFKRRAQLPQLIDDIWLWENAEAEAAEAGRSRFQAMELAFDSPCVCNGEWPRYVLKNFEINRINIPELCYDIRNALANGRSETTPVVVLAGVCGGEGKSVFLKPLHSIFDRFVFNVTKEAGNFPWLDLPGSKVAFLDDFRFDEDALSFSSLCLWFDGSALPIGRPQNVRGATGNFVYKGSAPIFITTKTSDLAWVEQQAQVNPATGAPWDAEAAMLMRRIKIYNFTVKVPKPARKLPFCGRCFAHFLHTYASMWTPGA